MSRHVHISGVGKGITVAGSNSVNGKTIRITACELNAYKSEYDAAVVIAGAAGVDFSDVVWGQQSQEDLGIRPVEEGKFRDIIWDQYVANRIISRMEDSDAQDPKKVAALVLTSVQDFHTELKKFVFKSLTPIVRATVLEVVNGLHYSLHQRGQTLCSEDEKIDMCRLFMRWPFCNRQFNVLVGSMLRKNLMMQDGSMSTLRRTNEVNLAFSRNNVRMKLFLQENLGVVIRKFADCKHSENGNHAASTGVKCQCYLITDWERNHNEKRHILEESDFNLDGHMTYIAPGEHSLRPVNDGKRDRASDEGDRAEASAAGPKKRSVYATRFG